MSGFVRSFGVKAITAVAAQPSTSIQKKGASAPVVSMATISAPDPAGKPSVSRSQPKKYRSTHTNTPRSLSILTTCFWSSSK